RAADRAGAARCVRSGGNTPRELPRSHVQRGDAVTKQQPVSRTLRQAEARKRHAQPPDARTYALARLCMRALFKVCVGPTVLGLEHVPRTGPLLIVANHLSYLEPPLLTAVLPRRITYLALHELFEVTWLAPVLRLFGALPVKRGGARDLDA